MAEVTWFKVLTDIFSDDKIKIIQSMPEGDSLLVTWFKVLSQAGKTNDGGYIYLRKNIPYTPAMLATLFNKPQMIVELALKTFEQFEMIDIDESGYIFVTHWEKHQSIDALEKIKEQDRVRSANYRERKRLELEQNHVTVTLPSQPNHAIDIEKERDIKHTVDSDECDHQFETFWAAYPKKNGKADAAKKWKSYIGKMQIDFDEVMQGLARYIKFIEFEHKRGFNRAHMDGKTFVNQRQWESEWAIETNVVPFNATGEKRQTLEEFNESERKKLAERRAARPGVL